MKKLIALLALGVSATGFATFEGLEPDRLEIVRARVVNQSVRFDTDRIEWKSLAGKASKAPNLTGANAEERKKRCAGLPLEKAGTLDFPYTAPVPRAVSRLKAYLVTTGGVYPLRLKTLLGTVRYPDLCREDIEPASPPVFFGDVEAEVEGPGKPDFGFVILTDKALEIDRSAVPPTLIPRKKWESKPAAVIRVALKPGDRRYLLVRWTGNPNGACLSKLTLFSDDGNFREVESNDFECDV
jgi:hypothetical protein